MFEVVEISSTRIRLDPLRVVLKDKTGTCSGYELQGMLSDRGCWVEMADAERIVLLFAAPAASDDVARLKEQMMAIENEAPASSRNSLSYKRHHGERSERKAQGHSDPVFDQRISEPVSFSRRPFASDRLERIRFADAGGRIAAEPVIPYPPGIPVLYAGEHITTASVQYISELAKHGARFQGAEDPTLLTIAVLRDR